MQTVFVPMQMLLIAVFLLPVAQGGTASGDLQAGKALWEGPATYCRFCHGANGEGAFGPDLAGRGLTVAQFTRAVRKPWGVMPAFIESQISDREIADLVAYFDSLPPVAQPGPWRTPVPPGAPHVQTVQIAVVGCGQCHGVELNTPRRGAGGAGADFEWFKDMVYDHTIVMPMRYKLFGEQPPIRLRMGNYSPSRVPETLLQEIWSFTRDLGFLPYVVGRLGAGVTGSDGATYTLNVENMGLPGKGLTAEDLTISLVIPAGATVVKTTGTGYQGVRVDPEVKANVAVWQVRQMAPKDRQTFTLTLSRPGTAADNVRGSVRWTKPAVKTGPYGSANIAPAPIPRSTQ